jgi:hypothetical protein
MFANCSSLVKLSLPNVEKIGNNAFSQCCSLMEVDFPKATRIGIQNSTTITNKGVF